MSATRVEPPLHPPGPEKITINFHNGKEAEVDTFDHESWLKWCNIKSLSPKLSIHS